MPVVSVSMPQSLIDRLDEFIDDHGYSGRSEAVREGARGLLAGIDDAYPADPAVCVVVVMFDHDTGAESAISRLRHRHGDLVTSNVHCHARGACLELFVTEGSPDEIDSFVARTRAVNGVTSVEYNLLSADEPIAG